MAGPRPRPPARLLEEFVGHLAYGITQLRAGLERFVFLLGGSDGFTLGPVDGGTHLVQTETYRGLLARMSAKTISATHAKFQELNQALKQKAEG